VPKLYPCRPPTIVTHTTTLAPTHEEKGGENQISSIFCSVKLTIASDSSMAVCSFTCIFVAPSAAVFPHPFTRTCLCSFNQLSPRSNLRIRPNQERTFNASFLEKLFSQCPQGKGFTAKWIRLCRLRSWLRLKDCGHWSHLNGRSFCCPTFE
jgi:hypothetical protein